MEPVTCRSHGELTNTPYSSEGIHAVLQPFGKKIYIISKDFHEAKAKEFEWIILHGVPGSWVILPQARSLEGDRTNADRTNADEPYEIPAIYLNSIFRKYDTKAGGMPGNEYRYISVVKGRCGWKAKLVVSDTYNDLSHSVFHEALNGYSTVFSGVVTSSGSSSVFNNSRVERISSLGDIRRLSTGTLGVVF